MNLLTEADFAEILGIPKPKVSEWRRQYGWPHVKIGRTIRFTQQHVDEILRLHTEAPGPRGEPRDPGALPGQTARSARYNRAR